MVGTVGKLIKPTGFETLQAKAKREGDLADNFLEQSQNVDGTRSWAQVLARLADAFVANRLRARSDKDSDSVTEQLKNTFATTHQQFQADAKTMTPEQLTAKWGGNQFAADDLKPYADAYADALKNREALKETPNGLERSGDILGKGPILDPEKNAIPVGKNPDGSVRWGINPLKVAGAQLDQMTPADAKSATALSGIQLNVPNQLPNAPVATPSAPAAAQPPAAGGPAAFTPANISQVESGGHDFNADGSPVTSPKGAMYGMQVMPSTARQPGYGVTPVPPNIMALPATDPRRAAAFDALGAQYAQAMKQRFGALGPAAYNAGPGRVANAGGNLSALPAETQGYSAKFAPPSVPTQANRPPDRVVNGQPFWQVNGQWFDNAAGQ